MSSFWCIGNQVELFQLTTTIMTTATRGCAKSRCQTSSHPHPRPRLLTSPQMLSFSTLRHQRTTITCSEALKAKLSSSTAVSAAANSLLANTNYFATDQRPIILFDGMCNLCNGAVNFMLDWDTQGAFRLAALQSDAGRALLQKCGRHPDDISSIVLVQADGQHFIRSEAVLRIAQGMQVCGCVCTAGSTCTAMEPPIHRCHFPGLLDSCFQYLA